MYYIVVTIISILYLLDSTVGLEKFFNLVCILLKCHFIVYPLANSIYPLVKWPPTKVRNMYVYFSRSLYFAPSITLCYEMLREQKRFYYASISMKYSEI